MQRPNLRNTGEKRKKEASASAAKPNGERVRGAGSQTVYHALRKAILELELAPGSGLDEVRLSEQFRMSRTPIREALVRLAAEGLVNTLPNRNTIVAPIDFVRLPVYFEALTLMYRVTTRSAAVHRKPEHLAKIRSYQALFAESVRQRDALAMIEANRDFHVAIAETAGNHYFTGLFTRLLDEGRRILRLYYSSFDDRLPRQYVEEHERIIAAVESGDAELCERLATDHAAQIVRQIQSYLVRDTAAQVSLDAGS
ncbi:GntR family transcriptional regulator [Chelativorans sp. AA-79]|uniref:GntR family transcriptional regulator n=1 Tax=Chelativorans sp. AA-79 TaxID=3028735 RepID=UPI0023F8BC74|nr:GntR family transcriptional regulator [Chelativorans sp. AA-79]WEX10549.1 GntR family transcriptional regulator [Chelativorans sp. AA-79]